MQVADGHRGITALDKPLIGPLMGRCFHDFQIFLTFLGDFNPQKLPSRGLQTLWELKNRVLLEEYSIFNVVNPLEVE